MRRAAERAPLNAGAVGLGLLHQVTRGSGEPVVFLHGLGATGASWRPQVEALRSHYAVTTIDLRGHGASPAPPGAWTMADFANDVAAAIRSTVTVPVHLVGLSLGGMVAFQLAVDHPALVRSAAIINSGPAFPGHTVKGKLLIWSRLTMIRWRGVNALGPTIARRLFPQPEQAPLVQQFLAEFVKNDSRHYACTLRAIGAFDLSQRLNEVRCPVLAISGDRDYTPVAAKEAWVRRLAHARLVVINDSGHASPIDQPEAVNSALRSFWDEIRTTPA